MDYPLLDDFTAFIGDTGYGDLPPEAVEVSLRTIPESIGCALAGSTRERGRINHVS